MPVSEVPAFFIAKVDPGGQQFDASTSQPLLLSLEQGGIDWPSSCRAGNCRTCICELTNGQVRYEVEPQGLSEEEKTQGFVLPCLAYPRSDLTLRREPL